MNRTELAVTLVLTALLVGACGSTPGTSSSSDDLEGESTTTVISAPSPTGSTVESAPSTTGPSASNPSTTVARIPTTLPSDAGDVGGVVTGVAPDAIIQDVFAAAEALTGLDRVEMTLLRANVVTWNDGSLGCPVPGSGYTQALVEGYWIQLALPDNTGLDYRVAEGGQPKLCDTAFALPAEGADR